MSEAEKNEVEQRLLEVLLAEQFAADEHDAPNLSAPRFESIAPGSFANRSAPFRLAAAAMILLGLAVVAMTVWLREPDSGNGVEAQDPQGAQLVEIKDRAAFLQLLGEATELRLQPKDVSGAYAIIDGTKNADGLPGATDNLDFLSWPEQHRIRGSQLEPWRAALRASKVDRDREQGFYDAYEWDLVLSDNRIARCFVSWRINGNDAILWLGKDPVAPGPELVELMNEVHQSLLERHRLASGRVYAPRPEQLETLSEDAQRIDLSVELAARAAKKPFVATVRRLCLRGQMDASAWQLAADLPQLRELELVGSALGEGDITALTQLKKVTSLVLRECEGLTSAAAGRLRALTRLAHLHLIDTLPGGDEIDLTLLAALPELREFGLGRRSTGTELPRATLEVLLRTKLQRLVLVNVTNGLDLDVLAGLPTLRELVLVGPIDDDDLQKLHAVRSLQSLVLRNTRVTSDGAEDLKKALLDCRLDWRPNGRWFDSTFAFDYVPAGGR